MARQHDEVMPNAQRKFMWAFGVLQVFVMKVYRGLYTDIYTVTLFKYFACFNIFPL